MYTGYVVKAGETAPEARIALGIKNFNYENEDVICTGRRGYITNIDRVMVIEETLNKEFNTPEEALTAYLDYLNTPTE